MLLLAAGLAACGLLPQRGGGAAVAGAAADPSRLILLTVDNPVEPLATHAGSSLRGYDLAPRYAAGDSARAALDGVAADYRLQPLAQWPIQPLQVHCVVYRIADGESREAVLARLARDPRVRLAQPMQDFATLSGDYNDPYVGLQRGFAQIDAAGAQQWSRGEGIRVALIDTGLDSGHPDLQGRVEIQRNFVDDDSRQFQADRHGTEVAGVIAADANNREGIVGIAPGVRILALKACWQLQPRADGAQCNSFTLAQALTIAIDSGARVINLSLGGPADSLLSQLVSYALKRGIVVVGAVPPGGEIGFPGAVPGVIAVDAAERPAGGDALRAPGHEVLTLTPGGHYDFVSGSSLAAAHVSGAAALLLQVDPGLEPAGVAALLRRSAAAAGEINICAALALLQPERRCGTQAAAVDTK